MNDELSLTGTRQIGEGAPQVLRRAAQRLEDAFLLLLDLRRLVGIKVMHSTNLAASINSFCSLEPRLDITVWHHTRYEGGHLGAAALVLRHEGCCDTVRREGVVQAPRQPRRLREGAGAAAFVGGRRRPAARSS